jgi:maltose/moltooligosaccharide transporter
MTLAMGGVHLGFVLQLTFSAAGSLEFRSDKPSASAAWLAGTVTALLLPPLIGAWSDRTWNRYGRRRPYLLAGALSSSALLFLLPHASGPWLTLALLWLLGASLHSCVVPLRALVADKVPPAQRTLGFAAHSFFIGLGAVAANALPEWLERLGFTGLAALGLPLVALYACTALLVVTTLATFLLVKEEPPPDLAEFARTRERCGFHFSSSWVGAGAITGAVLGALPSLLAGLPLTPWHPLIGALVGAAMGAVLGSREILSAVRDMPRMMKQLAVVQIFSWLGLSCMWTFFARATAQQIFGVTDAEQPGFSAGAQFAQETLAWYPLACCVLAFSLPLAARFTSRRMVHSVALLIGGASLLATGYIQDRVLWQCTMIGVGLAWASVMALPYAMLSTAIPLDRVGIFMGLFHLFSVVPEMIAMLTLGPLASRLFSDDPVKLVMLGGASLLAAAVATQFVGEGPLLTPEYQSVAAEEGLLTDSGPTSAS